MELITGEVIWRDIYIYLPRGHALFGYRLDDPANKDSEVKRAFVQAGAEHSGLVRVGLGTGEMGKWYLGLDCAHVFDLLPTDALKELMQCRPRDPEEKRTYRNLETVASHLNAIVEVILRHAAGEFRLESEHQQELPPPR